MPTVKVLRRVEKKGQGGRFKALFEMLETRLSNLPVVEGHCDLTICKVPMAFDLQNLSSSPQVQM